MFVPEEKCDYWFTVEPYVLIDIVDCKALLYNTLDGEIIVSNQLCVINLLSRVLKRENCGVALLTYTEYQKDEIASFVKQLRDKYMGDIIAVNLSKGKPVQLFPYYYYIDKSLIKDFYLSENGNILENLSEMTICIDNETDVDYLVSYLKSIPKISLYNIYPSQLDIRRCGTLFEFLKNISADKYICSLYTDLKFDTIIFDGDFSYKILIKFPIDMNVLLGLIKILADASLSVEYIFEVSSNMDCIQAEKVVDSYNLMNYQLKPVYTGNNIDFFKENVFLVESDIISTHLSIKEIFIRQSVNAYDFGKLTIMLNGDVYANTNHPLLGNIYKNSIYEIVQEEMQNGKSWFRVREQQPCSSCIYRKLCPSPSDYEIQIGRYNLCHIKN